MKELFYSFCFGTQNHGYYYLKYSSHELISETQFYQPDGQLYTNIFKLKLDGSKVLAYQYHDNDWIDFSEHPANTYPSSAYPLLLARVQQTALTYNCVFEHDGSVTEMVLSRSATVITERHKDKLIRAFSMENDTPVKIDWGGPVSYLCSSFKEAISGSPLES